MLLPGLPPPLYSLNIGAGDIKNLKAFAQRFRDILPVDYFLVFSELEKALADELDFMAEAQSMEKVSQLVHVVINT